MNTPISTAEAGGTDAEYTQHAHSHLGGPEISVADYPFVENLQFFYTSQRMRLGPQAHFLRTKSMAEMHTLVGEGRVLIATNPTGHIQGMISVRRSDLPQNGAIDPSVRDDFRRARGGTAEINSFVVDAGQRGLGTGRKLITAAEEEGLRAFGINRVFSRVVVGNTAGEEAFAKAGYQIAGQSFRLDDPAVKLLVMTKTLG